MMKFGLFAINMGPCSDPVMAVRVAQAAEAAGFESVWTGEHIVLPDPRVSASPVPHGIGTDRGAASLSTLTRKARFSIRPSRSRSSRRTPNA